MNDYIGEHYLMSSSIRQDACKGCKLCIEVCPTNIIGVDEDGHTSFIVGREHICLKCGQCMAVCTTDAIQIEGISYDDNLFKIPKNSVNYENYTDLLASRRSVRNFKQKEVSQEVLQEILDSIDFAPYGASPNDVHITVINNRETIESALPHIEKFLDDIPKWMKNPIISFFIKRKVGIETFNTIKYHLTPISETGNYKLENGDRITRDAPALIIFHAEVGAQEHSHNALIYATYAMLATHALGLGATINGIVPAAVNKVQEVKDIFQIPKNHEAVISIMLGYPKYKYKKTIQRKKTNINWLT